MITLPNRAYTPEQKREVIEKIYDLWFKNPEMRLGQLIVCATDSRASLFYVEDKTLANLVERWTKEQEQ